MRTNFGQIPAISSRESYYTSFFYKKKNWVSKGQCDIDIENEI